jgi:hypothetical protein
MSHEISSHDSVTNITHLRCADSSDVHPQPQIPMDDDMLVLDEGASDPRCAICRNLARSGMT